jgi:hypothetical protein
MSRHIISLTLLAVFILSVGAPLKAEEDKTEKINQYVDQLLEIAPQNFELLRRTNLIKEADLTYQKSLTVPVSDMLDCKSKEELRLLLGLYLFDTNYSMIFDKRKEFQESWESGFQKTMEKLAMYGEAGVAMLPAGDLREMLDNPRDRRLVDVIINDIKRQVTAILNKARKDPVFIEVVVDELYGVILEGLYVVSKLALNEDLSSKQMVNLFKWLQQHMEGYEQIVDVFTGDKYFEEMFDRSQRENVLNPIHNILKANKGKLSVEDVKKVLSIIEPIRNQLVRKCD